MVCSATLIEAAYDAHGEEPRNPMVHSGIHAVSRTISCELRVLAVARIHGDCGGHN
jgi:hypothetical protein